MAGNAASLDYTIASRLRHLVVPREHGAWGMLLVPFLTGILVGVPGTNNALPLMLLTLLVISLFWLRTPLESWIGVSPLRAQPGRERRLVIRVTFALASLAAVSLAILFRNATYAGLLWLGLIAGGAFLLQALLRRLGRSTRMVSQIVGAAGLTVTAPAAYCVATGRLDTAAWALWLANWIFAGNQIHFVQLRIHAARAATLSERISRGSLFLLGHALMMAALVFAWRQHVLSGLALLAFLPAATRGLAWFVERPHPLAVRRLGWTELAHALGFGLLLTLAFHFGG
jgi:YwiC-like protein